MQEHVNQNVLCPPSPPRKVTHLRIHHKDFKVGQTICLERVKDGQQTKLSRPIIINGCYRIDKQKGFDIPIIHSGRKPIKITPGTKIG